MDEQIMREYQNKRNGGRERVYRIGGKYFINSDWGNGFSSDLTPVSETDMRNCLDFTNAPQNVVDSILNR